MSEIKEMKTEDLLALPKGKKQPLSEGLIKRITAINEIFEPIMGTSLEQAIDNFSHDKNPENEIRIFEEMARIYQAFCHNRCETLEMRKEVFGLLLERSWRPTQEVLEKADLVYLDEKTAQDLLNQYQYDAKPASVYVEKQDFLPSTMFWLPSKPDLVFDGVDLHKEGGYLPFFIVGEKEVEKAKQGKLSLRSVNVVEGMVLGVMSPAPTVTIQQLIPHFQNLFQQYADYYGFSSARDFGVEVVKYLEQRKGPEVAETARNGVEVLTGGGPH